MNPDASAPLLDGLTEIAECASAAILAVDRAALAERSKPDGSPVTAADQAAHAAILPKLARLLPGVPIVSDSLGTQRSIFGLSESGIFGTSTRYPRTSNSVFNHGNQASSGNPLHP